MTNLELAPHQQRVVGEKAELGERLRKLTAFIDSPGFAALPPDERARLQKQFVFMEAYAGVLDERIAAFTTDAPATEAQPKRYTKEDVDLGSLKWTADPTAMNPLGDKASYFVRFRDGREIRGAVQLPLDQSTWPASRVATLCAIDALRIANGEQP